MEEKYCTKYLNNIYDNKNWDDILNDFQPKINYYLLKVPANDRDDLEQEIKIKILEKMNMFIKSNHIPGFWEYLDIQKSKMF